MLPPHVRSLRGVRWHLQQPDARRLDDLVGHGLHPVVARVMALRWPEPEIDPDAITPRLDQLHDPRAMHGMDAAVDRLRRAGRDRQRLRVVTDYDVDGTTSSLVLQAALRLGAPGSVLDYHIPDRFTEGYGFSVQAAEAAARDGVDLIVTADIGVRDHAAVTRARELGVDVLVCDHHLPPGEDVPADALVLCPPQAACAYPNPALAACGVSLKVAEALLADHPRRDVFTRSLRKLTAIGTVADMVSLRTPENRALVALGLDALNHDRHGPGLTALIEVAGLTPGSIRTSDLGFRIGPRINAAGRVADASLVVRLLSERDPARARALAQQIDRQNSERKQLQRTLTKNVLDQLARDPALADARFVVAAGPEAEGWHRGVVGIVATKVKDEVHRPVAIVSIQGDRAVGSVRSVPGVHAVKALDHAADLLAKYGGHPAAAGFTVPTARLADLRARLDAYVDQHAAADALTATTEVDAVVDVADLTHDLRHRLERLGPFGMGNPEPRLVVRGVTPEGLITRPGGDLLKFDLRGRDRAEAVWWGGGPHKAAVEGHTLDVLGTLGVNVWRGRQTLQLQVQDVCVR